jgi:hypothetical protein
MNGKFFTFVKPFLSYIDNGNFFKEPFQWLYLLLAAVNLFAPIWLLIQSVKGGVFDLSGKYIFAFILIWLLLAGLCWLCFQLWWDRSKKVALCTPDNSDFIAIPVLAHFIQTLGEWLGLLYGLGGTLVILTLLIFGAEELTYYLNIPMKIGFIGILGCVISGFLIVVVSRFLAESIKAVAAIANNTKPLK